MVAYKVRKLDGTWHTLGSGSQAKIRALDGSWYVEGNTGPPDAKVRLLTGTMGPGVPFGADGDTIYSTATYSLGGAPSPSRCILQGDAGIEPDREFHNGPGSSTAVSYRLRSNGSTDRQDFIAFFPATHTTVSPLEGAPTAPPGTEVVWCDADGTERPDYIVDVLSVDVRISVVAGVGGLSPREGASVIARATPFDRNIPSALYLNQEITPTTAHATNGPTGSDLVTFPTSTSIGTQIDAGTVSRNGSGTIGVHCGINWAITATTFDLGGATSTNIGRWLSVSGSAMTYKRYYKFVPIA